MSENQRHLNPCPHFTDRKTEASKKRDQKLGLQAPVQCSHPCHKSCVLGKSKGWLMGGASRISGAGWYQLLLLLSQTPRSWPLPQNQGQGITAPPQRPVLPAPGKCSHTPILKPKQLRAGDVPTSQGPAAHAQSEPSHPLQATTGSCSITSGRGSEASASTTGNPRLCADLLRVHVGKLRPGKKQKVVPKGAVNGDRAWTKRRVTGSKVPEAFHSIRAPLLSEG